MDHIVPELNKNVLDMDENYTYQDLDNIMRNINQEENLSVEEQQVMRRLQEILTEEQVVPRGRGGKKRKKKTRKNRRKTKKRKTRIRGRK